MRKSLRIELARTAMVGCFGLVLIQCSLNTAGQGSSNPFAAACGRPAAPFPPEVEVSVTALQRSYSFEGQCTIQWHWIAGAYRSVSTTPYRVTGSYDAYTGKGKEWVEIDPVPGYFADSKWLSSEFECTADPWIAGGHCTPTAAEGTLYDIVPAPLRAQRSVPVSAPVLEAQQREELRFEVRVQAEAIELHEPREGEVYDPEREILVQLHQSVPSDIEVTVAEQSMVVLERQHPSTRIVELVPMHNAHGLKSLRLEPGIWELRAQISKPTPVTGRRTSIRRFAVGGQLAEPPAPADLTVLTPSEDAMVFGDLQVVVELGPNAASSHVRLLWWWNPPSPPSGWPAAPVAIDTLPAELDLATHPGGLTIPHASFGHDGTWTLEASVPLAGGGSLEANEVRHFEVQSLGSGSSLLRRKLRLRPLS